MKRAITYTVREVRSWSRNMTLSMLNLHKMVLEHSINYYTTTGLKVAFMIQAQRTPGLLIIGFEEV